MVLWCQFPDRIIPYLFTTRGHFERNSWSQLCHLKLITKFLSLENSTTLFQFPKSEEFVRKWSSSKWKWKTQLCTLIDWHPTRSINSIHKKMHSQAHALFSCLSVCLCAEIGGHFHWSFFTHSSERFCCCHRCCCCDQDKTLKYMYINSSLSQGQIDLEKKIVCVIDKKLRFDKLNIMEDLCSP